MRRRRLLASCVAAFAIVRAAQAQQHTPQVDALVEVEALNARVLASSSATAALEDWCREHRLADEPRIVARVVDTGERPASDEQRRRLAVGDGALVKHRRVELRCGVHVLSQADNWYVPARLTAEMNRLLETTDTPFGRAVAALAPTRETFSVRLLWTDSAEPIPELLFEHRAVLSSGGRPFAEVTESYRRELLAGPRTAAADAANQAIRAARAAQNEAIAAGDFDRAARSWTDDVTVRRALGQPLSGRDAARRALETAISTSPRIVYQRLTGEVDVSDRWPLAFESGTWEGHLDSAAGPAVVGGRFSAQWVRRADRWLIRSEVFVALTCTGVGCQSVAVP